MLNWDELTPWLSLRPLRAKFQGRYFILVGICYNEEDMYCVLESNVELKLDNSYSHKYLIVRMSDFSALVSKDCPNFYGLPYCHEWATNLIRLILDESVDSSKISGFLLKHGKKFRARRNWFGSVDFEVLSAKQIAEHDRELLDALFLNWEYDHDDEVLNQALNLIVNHSGFQFTLKDVLMKF